MFNKSAIKISELLFPDFLLCITEQYGTTICFRKCSIDDHSGEKVASLVSQT